MDTSILYILDIKSSATYNTFEVFYMLKINDIRMRDSFIAAHNGVYYLYGTIGEQDREKNLYVFKSIDLENFEEPQIIFTLSDDSWGKQELWAPEVHTFGGKWYLFISILGKNGLRGTQIAVSDAPDGLFEPVANRPATPLDKSCIDGTLYVENEVPYIVYSRDWPDNFVEEKGVYVGQIAAQELSLDLKDPIGEPFVLFETDEAPISAGRPAVHEFFGKTVTRYGSDGPFLKKLKNGRLLLLWSPIPNGKYLIASAYSEGGIKGKFIHNKEPIFDRHGGHAMLFKDFENRLRMSFHWPEKHMAERTRILTVEETETSLKVID